MRLKGFYFIAERSLSKNGIVDDVREAIRAGACCVQYRDEEAKDADLLKTALALKRICGRIPLIINDRIDIALASNAAGVHLGQDDLPYAVARRLLGKHKIIGVTVRSLQQALKAEKEGADYLGVAPIFRTATKKDAGRPVGSVLIRRIKKRVKIPLVAIGGINLKNAQEVIEAGADCLCAISALFLRQGIFSNIQSFKGVFSCAK